MFGHKVNKWENNDAFCNGKKNGMAFVSLYLSEKEKGREKGRWTHPAFDCPLNMVASIES